MYFLLLIYILTLFMILKDATILNYGMVKSLRWSRLKQKEKKEFVSESNLENLPRLFLFMSVLREQAVLEETINYLLQMKYPLEKIKIFIITSEREISEAKANEVTTIEIADNITKNVNEEFGIELIERIHFPRVDGHKADQVNYAFQRVYEKYRDIADECYLTMYDADSRPDFNSLLYIGKVAAKYYEEKNYYPPVLQQPAIYLANFNKVNTYMQIEGIAETRWAFGYEIYNMMTQLKRKNPILKRLVYCVGHGVIIRLSQLKSIGGFPCPNEDVPLGNRLSMIGVPITPIPIFDYSEVAWSVSSLIKQSAVWFGGGYQFFKDVAFIIKRKDRLKGISFLTLVLHGIYVILTWFHYIFHFLSLIILSVFYQLPEIAFISITSVYLDYGLGTVIVLSHVKEMAEWINNQPIQLSFFRKVYFILISPLRGLVRGLGPLVYFKNKLVSKIFKGQFIYSKTERPT
ncbi:MAG: glycosyltransferase family 2 protein [Halanaerobiales bacterium]|nr:glycosyltransferase family 2 protein [Halanaerobiales bacterium]